MKHRCHKCKEFVTNNEGKLCKDGKFRCWNCINKEIDKIAGINKEQFNLSEKIAEHQSVDLNWIDVEDVREFIKRLKEEIEISEKIFLRDTTESPFTITKRIKYRIDKLAGGELKC